VQVTRLHALSLLPFSFVFFLPTDRAAERTVQETFPVKAGCVLSVDTYRGGMVIEESEGTEVRVVVHIESTLANEHDANQAIDALKLELKSEGNRVSVLARNPQESRLRFVWNDDEPLDLSFQISVPKHCNMDLATGNGGIVVGVLAGDMKARTETGTIFFRGVDGSVQASSGGGDVVVSRCSGDLSLTTRRGNIRAGTVHGRAELKAANGDIDVLSAEGGLVASTEAGDVTAGFPRGITEGAVITASAGNIFAKLDPALNCAVKATSVWGHVETTLPFALDGAAAKSKLSGRLNQGGPLLTLRANGGHVKIEKGDEPVE
jgi:DUF4097 and DUF4098 domain-containing protein YvlB